MMSEIIDVIVLVFPNGITHWVKKMPVYKDQEDPNHEYINKCVCIWRDKNKDFSKEYPDTDMAICQIKMPEHVYQQKLSTLFAGGIDETW